MIDIKYKSFILKKSQMELSGKLLMFLIIFPQKHLVELVPGIANHNRSLKSEILISLECRQI